MTHSRRLMVATAVEMAGAVKEVAKAVAARVAAMAVLVRVAVLGAAARQ